MSWKDLVTETLRGITVYTFLGTVCRRVIAGTGSEAENQLVASMKTVALEYETNGLAEIKRIEQAEITELQRRFDEKHGTVESGHIITTIEPKKPHE